MAEFQEVMRQFERMCRHYQRNCECPMGCPMNGVNISQCRKIAFEKPDVTEKIIMSWAAEHPEPVYPSWYEYLTDMYSAAWNIIEDKSIPADIAEKLGIEPKNG